MKTYIYIYISCVSLFAKRGLWGDDVGGWQGAPPYFSRYPAGNWFIKTGDFVEEKSSGAGRGGLPYRTTPQKDVVVQRAFPFCFPAPSWFSSFFGNIVSDQRGEAHHHHHAVLHDIGGGGACYDRGSPFRLEWSLNDGAP